MHTIQLTRKRFFRVLLVALCFMIPAIVCAQSSHSPDQDEELQLGQQVYDELKDKGEIVESSPLYDVLRPITDPIARVAQPRYNHPFKFYIVHETKPNAFAAPGGNVYVIDSMLYFVKNKEELAGTLCHEVSHTIHHDTMTLMKKQEDIIRREVVISVLLGADAAQAFAIAMVGKLHSLKYSRDVESQADLTGADVCAAAGDNPWGLVWLFQDFENADTNQVPQILSDHPGNANRVEALKRHFKENPSVFGKFSSDPKSASSISVPKDAPEVFVH
jgi:beta-barrel assembly-enhancing protease